MILNDNEKFKICLKNFFLGLSGKRPVASEYQCLKLYRDEFKVFFHENKMLFFFVKYLKFRSCKKGTRIVLGAKTHKIKDELISVKKESGT